MPTLSRALVILIGREVTRTSDRTLAVSDLDRRNQLVDLLVIVCEIAEITERRSRVVKLARWNPAVSLRSRNNSAMPCCKSCTHSGYGSGSLRC